MPMTPLDAENLRFPVVMRGYDRREVDEFRMRVAGALEEYINQLGALRARIGELETSLARYRENEELLKNSVVFAQRTADELAAAAHQRADAIVAAAHAEAATIRQDLAGLRGEREEFEYAFYGLLYGFLKRLERANPALRQVDEAADASAPARPSSDVLAVHEEAASHVEQLSGYTEQPPAKAPLLSEMLPGRLSATPPAATRVSPRDADTGSFAEALSRAGLDSEHGLRDEPPAPPAAPAPLLEETSPPPEGPDQSDAPPA